jgi:hypothetical protein
VPTRRYSETWEIGLGIGARYRAVYLGGLGKRSVGFGSTPATQPGAAPATSTSQHSTVDGSGRSIEREQRYHLSASATIRCSQVASS